MPDSAGEVPAVAAKPEGFATPQEALASLNPLHAKIAEVADKTPGTVLRAFLPDEIDVAGIVLPPVTMRTWLYLEKIESPFVQGAAGETTLEDILRAFYVISQPPDEVGAAVRGGEARFALAVEAFAQRLPIAHLAELAKKLADHLAAEFEPRASFARDEEGGGGPKPTASSATAPVAG